MVVIPIIQQVTIDVSNPSKASTVNITANQRPQTVELFTTAHINTVFIQPQITEQSVIEVLYQQGDKGDKGGVGVGEQGLQGISAYQVAVTNGFIGTENQWLISLKGDSANINGGYF